ncbi:MAG: phosphoribosylaminoimidazolesuccinocarboxamide synthase [Deltaproteobacteria bacterium]|nr:phosphoribosylaminoimidazolesuccinocarboxamide synthase [Deltaproteobacteria bacterium]
MEKKEKLYEGKAKIIYATDDPDLLIAYFKDDATAFDNTKRGTIVGKGIINNAISSRLFEILAKNRVPNHFVEKLSDREMLIRKLEMLKLEVLVRNVVAGSLAKRMGMAEGTPLKRTVLEYCYKNDLLHDPQINEDHVLVFELCTDQELINIRNMALKVNDVLTPFFDALGIRLIDFKLEFGRFKGETCLGDEISPDSCRLWDKKTNEKLDKDRFRRDMGGIEEAYKTVLERVIKT